ncbi:uncharacterized protein LOC142142519 [Mixophyes fleayi]|uniref:uncharacterized protein LOC142142519 n=1 Tax=Mixophyes fleayi TaxID=3061075 RepID=UPI003F4D7373
MEYTTYEEELRQLMPAEIVEGINVQDTDSPSFGQVVDSPGPQVTPSPRSTPPPSMRDSGSEEQAGTSSSLQGQRQSAQMSPSDDTQEDTVITLEMVDVPVSMRQEEATAPAEQSSEQQAAAPRMDTGREMAQSIANFQAQQCQFMDSQTRHMSQIAAHLRRLHRSNSQLPAGINRLATALEQTNVQLAQMTGAVEALHVLKNTYPLPLISVLFDQLRGATVFTKIDLRGAYNLIRIKEGDEWKTAFNTHSGHYEYLVMPFGLSNAPAVFQDLINEVLRDFLGGFVVVYLDDILIYSKSLLAHQTHVKQVLQKLRENHLYAKLEKCEFEVQKVSFLGYVISSEGFSMDSTKVQAIVDWVQPNNLKAVQRFLGFSNYYRRFIHNFADIVAPIVALTRSEQQRVVIIITLLQGDPQYWAFNLAPVSPSLQSVDAFLMPWVYSMMILIVWPRPSLISGP